MKMKSFIRGDVPRMRRKAVGGGTHAAFNLWQYEITGDARDSFYCKAATLHTFRWRNTATLPQEFASYQWASKHIFGLCGRDLAAVPLILDLIRVRSLHDAIVH